MSYCPLFIELENQPVIIVGGGPEAYAKCQELISHKALVTIWAAEFGDDLRDLKDANSDHISILKAELTVDMAEQILKGKNAPVLLVLAGPDPDYNAQVEKIAEANKVLVNNISNPHCRYQFSANIKRGGIRLAAHATEAPQLSSALGEALNTHFPQHWVQAYDRYMDLAASDHLSKLPKDQRIQELRQLATALVQADGDMEDALGILSGRLEIKSAD